MRLATRVDEGTAGRVARATVRYRLARPAFWVPVVVELAVAGVLAGAGRTGWAIFVAAVALAMPVMLLTSARPLTAALRRRGYRPGTEFAVDWEAETFTVSTGDTAGAYRYEHVGSARAVGDAVVFRVRGTRVLVVLPADVVPETVRPRLGLRGRP